MAGHSLGEYTALTAAESLRLADAVQLVRARGQFMQEAVPKGTGAMAAVIGLDDDKIEAVCTQVATETGLVIEAVNYNAPGQLVIAGHAEAVEASLPVLKEAERSARYHYLSALHFIVRLWSQRLSACRKSSMQLMSKDAVPVIQNVSIQPESDVSLIREQLIKKHFRLCVGPRRCSFRGLGVQVAAEFGPGAVLCGLAKRIQTDAQHFPLGTHELFTKALLEINA